MNLVSIIIPLYNRESLVLDTLESIKNQTYQNWECIIVDDHSSDNSYHVVQEYIKDEPRFRLLKRPDSLPKGANACRNFGLQVSNGEFINWFDSDDLMPSENLLKHVETLCTNPEVDFSVSDYSFFSHLDPTERFRDGKPLLSDNLLNDYIQMNVKFLTPNVFIRKQFLQVKNLAFDNELCAAQEYHFFSNLLMHTSRCSKISDLYILIREHNNSISHSVENKFRRAWCNYVARKKIEKTLKDRNSASQQTRNYLNNYSGIFLFQLLYNRKFLLITKYFKTEVYYKGFSKAVLTNFLYLINIRKLIQNKK